MLLGSLLQAASMGLPCGTCEVEKAHARTDLLRRLGHDVWTSPDAEEEWVNQLRYQSPQAYESYVADRKTCSWSTPMPLAAHTLKYMRNAALPPAISTSMHTGRSQAACQHRMRRLFLSSLL